MGGGGGGIVKAITQPVQKIVSAPIKIIEGQNVGQTLRQAGSASLSVTNPVVATVKLTQIDPVISKTTSTLTGGATDRASNLVQTSEKLVGGEHVTRVEALGALRDSAVLGGQVAGGYAASGLGAGYFGSVVAAKTSGDLLTSKKSFFQGVSELGSSFAGDYGDLFKEAKPYTDAFFNAGGSDLFGSSGGSGSGGKQYVSETGTVQAGFPLPTVLIMGVMLYFLMRRKK